MRLHGNARTCLHSRLLIVERVLFGHGLFLSTTIGLGYGASGPVRASCHAGYAKFGLAHSVGPFWPEWTCCPCAHASQYRQNATDRLSCRDYAARPHAASE
jgi:hypothetical protein